MSAELTNWIILVRLNGSDTVKGGYVAIGWNCTGASACLQPYRDNIPNIYPSTGA